MVNLDVAELRPKLDLEGKYVDFNLLRTALSAWKVVTDLDVFLSEPNKEGECRSTCPKCGKEKSFSLNINTNRFNCFAKGCHLKGGGVIDFCAKLYEVSAKEASHLIACAYGIQPYGEEVVVADNNHPPNEKSFVEDAPPDREVAESSINSSQPIPPLTPQHLIASIEHQLAQLKQMLTTR
jgi:hypothetical protein